MKNYKPFAVTVTGDSHIKHGKGCEDSTKDFEDANVVIAAVADGHGDDNCFRSAKGAEIAVSRATTCIYEFVNYHKPRFSHSLFKKEDMPAQDEFNKAICDLIKSIIASWQIKVEEDYTASPFTQEELEKADEKHRKNFKEGKGLNKAYGATLIAAAITQYYWFGIHIGDGRLTALYPDGSFKQPVPWDKKCYLNVTTSICDDDAYERIIKMKRYHVSFHTEETPPVAVFLCSDGVDDNYPVDDNDKHLFKLYRTIALTFAEDGYESTCEQLKKLANQFATKGKGDDTSIAGFIDMEAVKQAVPIWKEQIAGEEKAAAGNNE